MRRRLTQTIVGAAAVLTLVGILAVAVYYASDATAEDRPLLKQYRGNARIADDLYAAYERFAHAIESGDQEALGRACLPGAVLITTRPGPAANADARELNLPLARAHFLPDVLSGSGPSHDAFLLVTKTSHVRLVESRAHGWTVYRYGGEAPEQPVPRARARLRPAPEGEVPHPSRPGTGPAPTARTDDRPLLKGYEGKVEIPDDLYRTYSTLAASLLRGDRDAIAASCLPGAVLITSEPRPGPFKEFGTDVNLPYSKANFAPEIWMATREAEGVFVLCTATSHFYFAETKHCGWMVYRYGDKPIE